MKKLIFFLSILFTSSVVFSQNYKIGVRAGLNYFKLNGDLEQFEESSLESGFHFGINGTYYFNDIFGLRAELLYIQKSSLEEHNGTTYAILGNGGDREVVYGTGSTTLGYTFNTFTVPLTAVINPISKIEVFVGANFEFMVGPTAQGNFDFTDETGTIRYIQTLAYDYNNDTPGGFNSRGGEILLPGDRVLPKSVGAFYYFPDAEKAFRTFDISLTGGLSYFINPGLYVQGRIDYGLFDTTKTQYDYAREDINDDESFIFREDDDRKVGFQVSIGFRF